jgi:hypothetical protein
MYRPERTHVPVRALIPAFAVAATIACLAALLPATAVAGGFDEVGYNRTARIFSGTCLSWGADKLGSVAAAESYCGASLHDQLVMKWNKAWDECNKHGNDDAEYCAGAWLTNQWNGRFPGGSGETAFYKFIWVGSDLESSAYWRPGGVPIWTDYEWTMAQGSDESGHWWLVHARPNGFGPAS